MKDRIARPRLMIVMASASTLAFSVLWAGTASAGGATPSLTDTADKTTSTVTQTATDTADKTTSTVTQTATDTADKTSTVTQTTTETISTATQTTTQKVDDVVKTVEDTADGAAESVGSATGAAKQTVTNVTSGANSAVKDVSNTAAETTAPLTDTQQKAPTGTPPTSSTTSSSPQRAPQTAPRTTSSSSPSATRQTTTQRRPVPAAPPSKKVKSTRPAKERLKTAERTDDSNKVASSGNLIGARTFLNERVNGQQNAGGTADNSNQEPAGGLPFTGLNILVWLMYAGMLVGAGALLIGGISLRPGPKLKALLRSRKVRPAEVLQAG